MYLDDLIAKAGSYEEFVASESVCNVCSKIVQLPGKKCSWCTNLVCSNCLEDIDELECIRCKKGSLKELDMQQKYLIRKLTFGCPSETCSKELTKYIYKEYQEHLLIHSNQINKEIPQDLELPQLLTENDDFDHMETARFIESKSEEKDQPLQAESHIQSKEKPEFDVFDG